MRENETGVRVRPYAPGDEEFVMKLAPRLAIGIPEWRSPELMVQTARNWLSEGITHHGTKSMVFIAVSEEGKRLGVATVSHSTHFTGERQADLGELIVDEGAEGKGVGRALVGACERWAREQGYTYLTLATGAPNERARRLYEHLGFLYEDVRFTMML